MTRFSYIAEEPMEFTLEERIRRLLQLADSAAAQGRIRQAWIFRQMARDLAAPVG
jgi:hypothetical protein